MIWQGQALWAEWIKKHGVDTVLTIRSIVGDKQINQHISIAVGPFQTQRQLILPMAQGGGFTVSDPGNMLDDTSQLPCSKVLVVR